MRTKKKKKSIQIRRKFKYSGKLPKKGLNHKIIKRMEMEKNTKIYKNPCV